MNISNRLLNMENSPIRKLIPYADREKEKGKKIIHLNIGQPDIQTPPDFINEVRKYDEGVLKYADSRGLKRTIETTQLYLHNYGLDFDLDEILITNGASEALIFSLMTVLDYDDEVITVEPYYTNYNSFVKMIGGKLKAVPTYIEDGFKLPKKEVFEKIITKRTKAILLSSPANPTGRVYTKEEIDEIVNLAKKYDLFILADEVYREFNYTDRKFISFASYKDIEDRVILLDSISKKYSCCGARIGSITSKNKDIISNILKLCQARLAVSTLDQIGAGAMDIVDDEYVYNNRRIYKRRRNVLNERLSKIKNIKKSTPEGAFYTIVQLPVEDSEKFCIWLLENVSIDNYSVLLTPAKSFYLSPDRGKNEVRISYCVDEEMINKAMDILEKGLEIYEKKENK